MAFFHEQFFNAHHQWVFDYGEYAVESTGSAAMIVSFEERVGAFKKNLAGCELFGNEQAVERINAPAENC